MADCICWRESGLEWFKAPGRKRKFPQNQDQATPSDQDATPESEKPLVPMRFKSVLFKSQPYFFSMKIKEEESESQVWNF